jgi:enediyne biosynthesis protein E4
MIEYCRFCFLFFLLMFMTTSFFAIAQKPFTNVTRAAGINHQFDPFEGTFGGGACVFDFNNDGWEDIYITGGMADDMLYLNKKNGTFENVFEKSGLKTKIKYITQGVVSADINRDGWRDLFVTTITSKDNKTSVPRAMNLLFLNNGNGTFRDVTKQFGLDTFLTFSTGAMFGDVNLDGYPDLYVGNYFQQYEGKLHIMNDAIIVASKQMAKGLLLINKGGRSFKNEYADYGLDYKGFGFGGAFTDFDNDGDLDILVNHDFGYKAPPNKFLENKYPKEKLEDISDTINMQLPMNAMGTAVGDYNNDGWMDYYVTNIRANPFMVNQGKGKPFKQMNGELGTQINMIQTKEGGMLPVSWGTNFADFDQDGDLDLYVANGSLNPFVMPNPDYYFENINGHFKEMGDSMGVADRGISRGSVVFDYDHDGDLDILVVNQKPVNTGFEDASGTILFRNDMSKKGNWLQVQLLGVESDINGIGCKVEVVVGKLKMIREIDGGSSHESQNSVIAHFGVGNATIIDSINIYWLGGSKQIITHQKANQTIIIKEVSAHKKWYQRYYIWALLVFIFLSVIFFRKNFRNKKQCP